jgi:hypothetical protein
MSSELDDLPPHLRPHDSPRRLPAEELPLEELPEVPPPPAPPFEERAPDPYLRRS